ncbi:hypothetical protein QF038_001827 [Pseudarthrobacter sp. W1I19]|uniref:hypothetical protein n=1 Tax=Pseudarthrobacter sp. W1I19 TaxID=3042288 RepID=UPI0027818927|nr:hypothetical protein [Pseudarthrobacter sp. W1I19]MDQ0923319.1 hypothetical protein [Pseudarthrobacter sp. W1I19]
MRKRSAYLPGNKVLPETKGAFTEAAEQLGMTSTMMRLFATAQRFGHIKTSHGKLSEVIEREMKR